MCIQNLKLLCTDICLECCVNKIIDLFSSKAIRIHSSQRPQTAPVIMITYLVNVCHVSQEESEDRRRLGQNYFLIGKIKTPLGKKT